VVRWCCLPLTFCAELALPGISLVMMLFRRFASASLRRAGVATLPPTAESDIVPSWPSSTYSFSSVAVSRLFWNSLQKPNKLANQWRSSIDDWMIWSPGRQLGARPNNRLTTTETNEGNRRKIDENRAETKFGAVKGERPKATQEAWGLNMNRSDQ